MFSEAVRKSDSKSATRAQFVKVGQENDGLAFLEDSHLLVISALLMRRLGSCANTPLSFHLCLCSGGHHL